MDRYCSIWSQLGISQALIDQRDLPLYEEASDLETADVARNGKEFLLTPAAADAWRQMKAAANRDCVDIYIVSAYRSVQRQIELISKKLDAGEALEKVLEVLAPPGCSEHHTGNAIDLGAEGVQPLDPEFDSTSAFAWLQNHASRFGFQLSFPEGNRFGYVYEPWHWCYSVAGSKQTVPADARE